MSLLIKALEQAAKDRKAARADAEKASSETGQHQPASTEPTLEPPPPPRASTSARPTPDPAPAAGTQLSLDPSSPASTPRAAAPAAAAPRSAPAGPAAAARRTPTSLTSLANIDAQQERARAAAVMQASGNSAGQAISWLRANPVMLIAGLAVMFGVAFGLYVYLQVSHPGMFVRQAATKPQDAAPPAPPAAPPQPPGLPETAGAGTAPPAAPALAPPGTQPAGPGPASGTIASAAPQPSALPQTQPSPQPPPSPQPSMAPSAAPPSAPLPSSSVIGAAPVSEFPRTPPSERVTEARRERGNIRPPAPAETGEPAPAPPSRRTSAVAPGPEAGREGIRVSQTTVQPRLNPQLSQAYTALQSGNAEEARALYNRVVQAEPLNVDALLGLAYIAAQENRADDASKYYLRILQLNPRHSVAQAALIGLMGRADPASSESRLKQLIAREPSPFLHFVLGNLYADQAQWPQAQQSYFQAHHLEPENPDYAYNLAVGLDHLRQGKLALNFYRRADQLASTQGRSNFNLSHARERIRILSSQVE